ncbi:MaoC family dehydratase [Natrialba asiatica]|uniref:Dehydratase n=1 Tax=Natrialba asiatica (strain ATCC 700177 / DSM 12278 / JCM 9576 / FERM P-10747 / NBRC 102637 / 172P1) TaxID=29540 RepID=M0AI73_NATA1|nr:MaoC/PaaZ C-terminal domain-containing protein [Natrialba asiatica]ELY97073.1 dehydratase [Natrialba asiatica DSM 12278]
MNLDPDALSVGDDLPTFHVDDLDRTQIVRYLGASGDFNPLHHDDEFSRAAGQDGVIVPGMLVAGFASAAVTDWVPIDAVDRFRTRFVGTVRPGDSLRVSGTVAEVETDRTGNTTTVEISITVDTADGATVLEGDATISP